MDYDIDIDNILEDAFKTICPFDSERPDTESSKLKKAALKCYLLLAKGIGVKEGLEEARQVIFSKADR